MKKVILFLFALSTIVGAQAQFMSSGGVGSTKSGGYSSGDVGLNFSGKASTISSDSEAAVVPVYTTKSKSLFANLLSKDSEPITVAQGSSKSSKSYEPRLNKIYFSWNFAYESDDEFIENYDRDAIGFTFGYSRAINLFREWVYADCGLGVSWSERYYNERVYYDSYITLNFCEIRVPVNLMVNIKLTKKIYFRPYAGLSFDFNASTYTRSDMETYNSYMPAVFEVGYQFGAGFSMGRIYLGYENRWMERVAIVDCKFNSVVLGVLF